MLKWTYGIFSSTPDEQADPKFTSLELKNPQKLSALADHLKKLYYQEKKLIAEIKDDSANSSYVKCKIFELIMTHIRSAIKQFNQHNIHNAVSILEFVTKLKTIIERALGYNENRAELTTQKNDYKKRMKKAIENATYTGGLAIGYFTFSPILFVGAMAASRPLSNAIQSAASLDEDKINQSQSIILLDEMVEILKIIQKSMTYDSNPELKEEPESFLEDPISKEKIKKPVFCTLDGRIYEDRSIRQVLEKFRKSPFNNKELQPGQTPESVLFASYTLEGAIDELEEKYKLAAAALNMQVQPPEAAAPPAPTPAPAPSPH